MIPIQSQERLDAAFIRDIGLLRQELQQEQLVEEASLEEMRRMKEQQSLDVFGTALRAEVPEEFFSALAISVEETPLDKVQKNDPFFPLPVPKATFVHRGILWTIKMAMLSTSHYPVDGLPWQWHISYVSPDGYGGSRTTKVDSPSRSWLLWKRLCFHVGVWQEKDDKAREEARQREEKEEQARAIQKQQDEAKAKQDKEERAARRRWWEGILAEDKRLCEVVAQRATQARAQLWLWPDGVVVHPTKIQYHTWVPEDEAGGGSSVERSGWVISNTPDGEGFYRVLPTDAVPEHSVKPPYPPTFLRQPFCRTADLPPELRTAVWFPCKDILEVHYMNDGNPRLCLRDTFDGEDPWVDYTEPYSIELGEVPVPWVRQCVDEAFKRQGGGQH